MHVQKQEPRLSEADQNPNQPAVDATAEGARAKAQGLPRNACPYALDSEQHHEWLEGYDGVTVEGSPLVPEAKH
jgi:ribosome modulation factor